MSSKKKGLNRRDLLKLGLEVAGRIDLGHPEVTERVHASRDRTKPRRDSSMEPNLPHRYQPEKCRDDEAKTPAVDGSAELGHRRRPKRQPQSCTAKPKQIEANQRGEVRFERTVEEMAGCDPQAPGHRQTEGRGKEQHGHDLQENGQ